MVKILSQLKPNAIVRSPLFSEPLKVLVVMPLGATTKLIGQGMHTNQVHEAILTAAQLATLDIAPEEPPGDGDPLRFRLAIEALRLGLAYEYDPYFALSIARIDPLPHQLEASLIRSAQALTRLCLVLAVATLYLVAQGTEVVAHGKRRWVDPHWFRGNSYLRIGWQWVKTALYKQGLELLTHVHLSGKPDPEPSRASNKQFHQRHQRQLQAISSNLCA
ncbi:MAG TPA: hypothetical protein PLQ85_05840 [Anaerolineae bacterium]|nr:hypothetical protein [Anaerolineae bacterium]